MQVRLRTVLHLELVAERKRVLGLRLYPLSPHFFAIVNVILRNHSLYFFVLRVNAPHHLPVEAGEARCSRSSACGCYAARAYAGLLIVWLRPRKRTLSSQSTRVLQNSLSHGPFDVGTARAPRMRSMRSSGAAGP